MSKRTYQRVPKCPPDFEGACELHREAIKAIEYWEDLKKVRAIDRSSDGYKTAATAVKMWKRCKAEAQTVISSYQLTLF